MGAWTEIVDYTVPSNTTDVVLNDFGTITKDDFIKIHLTIVNPTGSNTNISLFPNTSSAADFTRQVLVGTGSTAAAAREADDCRLTQTRANTTSTAFAFLKLSENNVANFFSNSTERNDSSLETRLLYSTSDAATFSSGITSLKLNSSVTNAIGTDSRIQIYRLDAEKVADFTTTSNSTQVDIPFPSGTFDPAINKDSEYLLVSDTGGSSGDMFLYPNDLTTSTNYYSQRIQGNGSTAAAARANSARFLEADSGVGNIGYAHIKLSEIGAYTVQSYSHRAAFGSSLQIMNYFISSTSEAITSITKLNIKAATTNGIASGSRFILYKLK
jgi:hypothetical protein